MQITSDYSQYVTKVCDTDVINGCFYGWKNLSGWKGRDFFPFEPEKTGKKYFLSFAKKAEF